MNETMIERWNEVVNWNDTVYCLGDFSLNHSTVGKVLPRLMGHKILIAGNHDECHPVQSKNLARQLKYTERYEEYGFAQILLETTIKIADIDVRLHHMPYASDISDERFHDYRPEDQGGWLLCGHVHEKWFRKGRMINVGVDQHNFYPISKTLIEQWIKDGPVHETAIRRVVG